MNELLKEELFKHLSIKLDTEAIGILAVYSKRVVVKLMWDDKVISSDKILIRC